MPLMPYGSHKNAGLVTKVGDPKQRVPVKIASIQPYGSAENASLMTKVFKKTPPKTPASRTQKVVRLNAEKG